MEHSLVKGTANATARKPRSVRWAQRLVGLAIVASGGTLLAGDLLGMANLAPLPVISAAPASP